MRLGFGCAAMLVLALGCTKEGRGGGGGGGPVKPTSPPVPTPQVTATVSAVTLADDCAHADASAASERAAPSVAQGAVAGDCAGPNCGMPCQQTTMQLTLDAAAGSAPTTVKIVRVELTEKGGASLGEMQSRDPMLFVEAEGNYKTWDGAISAGNQLRVMYALGSPDWGKVGGRWNAMNKTFVLKVTLSIGGAESTVEKTVESPEIMIEPPVVT
ncbi:MAG: hypothetical protein IT370_28795 [Deltaproteobacteria bacterium]|nr:hypothetical protein [Deltaproteobacteria bacterium]